MSTGSASIVVGGELRCDGGMVAAAHPLAARAGVVALQAGGNAVDAAVATALALTVVDPGNNSLGGYGGFLLFAPRDGEPTVVNFNTRAPLEATPDMFAITPEGGVADDANVTGYRAVGVPGVLAGLELARERYGRLELARLLRPAIDLAAEGFEVNHLVACCTAVPHLGLFPATRAVFRPEGRSLREGERLVQRDYAEILRRIAREGPGLLYGGELGEAIVAHVRQEGGILSMEDLASYRATVEPASRLSYGEHVVASYPLETSGSSCVFETLNLLEGSNLRQWGYRSVETLELRIPAMRRAYSDRARVAALPPGATPSYAQLADKSWTSGSSSVPAEPVDLPGGHTTHLCVVDRDRNFVALTQTLGGQWFGSGVTVPGTGITLNCGMGLFNPQPGYRHSILPGSPALTNMAGSVVYRRGQPWAVTGTPGARRIISMVVGFLLGLMEHGMSPQECLAAPRIHAEGEGPVTVERSLPRPVIEELRRRGHRVGYHRWTDFYGPASAVALTEEGGILGGADPRFPGALAGY